MASFFLNVFLLLPLLVSSVNYCPADSAFAYFDPKTGLCYYLADVTDSWNNAVGNCVNLYGPRADMALPRNLNDEKYMSTYLYPLLFGGYSWIGAVSNAAGQWADTKGLSITYANWLTGQPSANSSCAVFSSFSGGWISTSCGTKLRYVCRVPTSENYTPQSAGSCPYGYIGTDGLCYFESQITGQWSYTRDGCRSLGLDLPLPKNAFDNTQLQQKLLIANHFTSMWLGGQSEASGTWMDSQGNPLSYTNWGQGEPMNSKRSSIIMKSDGTWASYYGNYTRNFGCRGTINA